MADPGEALGRIAWESRCNWLAEHAPGTMIPRSWEELDPAERELYERTASAVAAQAVADAGLAHERMRAQIFALDANRPAVFEALRFAIASVAYASEAKRYRAALKALGGDEEGEDRA